MTLFRDRELTMPTRTYSLGEKIFARIELTNMIVNASSIECTTMHVRQTHTDGGEPEDTDMKTDPKYLFEEWDPNNGTNVHACAAELESPHFHESQKGLDAILLVTVTVDYVQGWQ